MTELIKYEAARAALAAAARVDEVKDIHDKAAAMGLYARMANDRQMEADAIEIRMRAERRLGDMIAAQKITTGLHKGGGPGRGKTGLSKNPVLTDPPTLADAGIDKNLAHRARVAAKMSEGQFEEKVVNARHGKTPRPKGEPKPKGEKQPKAAVVRRINVEPEDWQAFMGQAKAEGMTVQDKLGQIVAGPEIKRDELSLTAQKKLDAALRQHQRDLDASFDNLVREKVQEQLEYLIMDRYREKMERYHRVINAHSGLMPRKTYRLILSCLHPDSRASVSDDKLRDARMAFEEREVTLCQKEKGHMPEPLDWPKTRADLEALKRKVAEQRAADRRQRKQTGNGVARA